MFTNTKYLTIVGIVGMLVVKKTVMPIMVDSNIKRKIIRYY